MISSLCLIHLEYTICFSLSFMIHVQTCENNKKLTGPVRRILHPQNNVGALKDHRISMGCYHGQRPCPALPSCDDLSRHSGDRGHSGQYCNCGLFAISGHAKWFFTRGPFGLRVLSLPASVCVCLSVCVSTFACPDDNSSPVQARFT